MRNVSSTVKFVRDALGDGFLQRLTGSSQYEVIHFTCGHSGRRLIKHCHFARNDLNHQCFGAWTIKREWYSTTQMCQACSQQAAFIQHPQPLQDQIHAQMLQPPQVQAQQSQYVCLPQISDQESQHLLGQMQHLQDSQRLRAQPLQAQPLQAQPLQAQPLQAQPLQAQPLQAQPLQPLLLPQQHRMQSEQQQQQQQQQQRRQLLTQEQHQEMMQKRQEEDNHRSKEMDRRV